MSTHLHDMNVGQPLSIRGPIPKYKWEENKYPPLSFLFAFCIPAACFPPYCFMCEERLILF